MGNGNVQRQAPSPIAPQLANNNVVTNGANGGMNGMANAMPVNAGQQMDVNIVFQKLIELSEVLKENRDKAQGIVAGAEELAVSGISISSLHRSTIIYFTSHPSTFEALYLTSPKARAVANGSSPSLQEANHEVSGASSWRDFSNYAV